MEMQLPVSLPSPRPPPLLRCEPLRRRWSFRRPGRRCVKYDQPVSLAATVIAIIYAARKISCGEGLPWPHCGVCRFIFFVGVLIFLPSSNWSLILPWNHAQVWGRLAIASGLLNVASLLTDYFAYEWKWASYLIWVLVCLPLLPSLAPLMTYICWKLDINVYINQEFNVYIHFHNFSFVMGGTEFMKLQL